MEFEAMRMEAIRKWLKVEDLRRAIEIQKLSNDYNFDNRKKNGNTV